MRKLSLILPLAFALHAPAWSQRIALEPQPQGDRTAPVTAPPVTTLPGMGPALGPNRITQARIESGELSLRDIRRAGMRVFSTPFNRFDGFGDGPFDENDPTSPGGRPMLQNNGTFLRVNGLDSQTCTECHSVLSARTSPPRFAVGGAGGAAANAFFQPKEIDVSDSRGLGFAFYDGRSINPPFIFGAGGVELVAKEMTVDLQALKRKARNEPGTVVPLVTKGVGFGSISYDAATGTFDTSKVAGVDPDLVVRPFGRKGNNSSARQFDIGALQFHHGMQPVEVVGEGVDDDGDGVVDEILVGELSALHVFTAATAKPTTAPGNRRQLRRGAQAFRDLGCATCHVPAMETTTTRLPIAYPEIETDPTANVYIEIDLEGGSAGFQPNGLGGVTVPMFSDLKRHDMGPELSESFESPLDPWFITPRLWGIADTAPYMHDGRALTITDAILMHGGDGQFAADNFTAAPAPVQLDLLVFLDTLRAPRKPNADIE